MNQHDDAVALHFQKYDADDGDNGDDTVADAVIILHGLFGNHTNWRNIATQLVRRAGRVYCVDLRNHGRSPWRDDMTYAQMADDVARFIAEHDLRRPSLVGHSMGGKVAMTLAARGGTASAHLAKLVVVDIAPVAYTAADHRALIDAMLAADLAGGRRDIDAALADAITDSATRQFLLQNLVGDGGGYRWRLNLAALRDNLETIAGYPDGDDGDDAADLAVADGDDGDSVVANGDGAVVAGDESPSAPQARGVLFIAGGKSTYLAPHHAAVRARFPAARIHTLADAGHWLHAEQPDELSALLQEFLR